MQILVRREKSSCRRQPSKAVGYRTHILHEASGVASTASGEQTKRQCHYFSSLPTFAAVTTLRYSSQAPIMNGRNPNRPHMIQLVVQFPSGTWERNCWMSRAETFTTPQIINAAADRDRETYPTIRLSFRRFIGSLTEFRQRQNPEFSSVLFPYSQAC